MIYIPLHFALDEQNAVSLKREKKRINMVKNRKNINDKLLTILIVVICVGGILYFGSRAVIDPLLETENPYAYPMDTYEAGPIASSWTMVQSVSLDSESPRALAVNNQNRIYVAGTDQIIFLSQDGQKVSHFSIPKPASCMAIDSSNQIYLAVGDHVEVWNEQGDLISTWESLGERAFLTSIAVSENHVYLSDAGQLWVWLYNPQGQLVRIIDGKSDDKSQQTGFVIPSPYFDVAAGPDESLWVANTGKHRLEHYDIDGNLINFWGDYSTNIEDFCGCCNPSHFTMMVDGSFITSEKGIPRVKEYDPNGKFKSVVASPDAFLPGTVGLDLAVGSDGRIYVLDPKKKRICIYQKKDEAS